tara:strand:- start:242 stop:553 length:312 start_codon:yes stop_codon:yes gene_type:complete
MKQTQKQMIMQVIEKHQESEAKLMKSINKVDADIEFLQKLEWTMCDNMKSKSIMNLNELREIHREEMSSHRAIIKELAPIIDKRVQCFRDRPCTLIGLDIIFD